MVCWRPAHLKPARQERNEPPPREEDPKEDQRTADPFLAHVYNCSHALTVSAVSTRPSPITPQPILRPAQTSADLRRRNIETFPPPPSTYQISNHPLRASRSSIATAHIYTPNTPRGRAGPPDYSSTAAYVRQGSQCDSPPTLLHDASRPSPPPPPLIPSNPAIASSAKSASEPSCWEQ